MIDHHRAVLGGRESGAARLGQQVDHPGIPQHREPDAVERRRPCVEFVGKPPQLLRRHQKLVDVRHRRARKHHHRQIERKWQGELPAIGGAGGEQLREVPVGRQFAAEQTVERGEQAMQLGARQAGTEDQVGRRGAAQQPSSRLRAVGQFYLDRAPGRIERVDVGGQLGAVAPQLDHRLGTCATGRRHQQRGTGNRAPVPAGHAARARQRRASDRRRASAGRRPPSLAAVGQEPPATSRATA